MQSNPHQMYAWRQMRIRGTEDSADSAYLRDKPDDGTATSRPSLPSIEPLSSRHFTLTPHWRSNVGIAWHFRAVINSENTCANPKAMPEKARDIR